MRIINDFNQIESLQPTAVTIGKFEAVHKGHQKLIREVAACKKQGLIPTVFTFKNATTYSSSPGDGKMFLEDNYRIAFMEKLGIELLIEIEFTEAFAKVSPEAFIKDILIDKLNAKVIVTGENFRFGKERRGDKELLCELQDKYGYEYRVFDMEKYHNKNISTTYAKELLKAQDFADLEEILGYDYLTCRKP